MRKNSKTKSRRRPNIHPGEILLEELLVPMKLTPYALALAQACGVPRRRIERLAHYFGTLADSEWGCRRRTVGRVSRRRNAPTDESGGLRCANLPLRAFPLILPFDYRITVLDAVG